MTPPAVPEAEIQAIIAEVTAFVEARRDHYAPLARRLDPSQRKAMRPYFSDELLDLSRIVISGPGLAPNPPFFYRARERGFGHMPDFSHLGEITYGHVTVFQTNLNDRLLFHALVHCAQYRALGVTQYVDRYIRAFVKTGLHVLVPIEVQAFDMDHRFAAAPHKPFSVEEEIADWQQGQRY